LRTVQNNTVQKYQYSMTCRHSGMIFSNHPQNKKQHIVQRRAKSIISFFH
jgi:hypothetical protein